MKMKDFPLKSSSEHSQFPPLGYDCIIVYFHPFYCSQQVFLIFPKPKFIFGSAHSTFISEDSFLHNTSFQFDRIDLCLEDILQDLKMFRFSFLLVTIYFLSIKKKKKANYYFLYLSFIFVFFTNKCLEQVLFHFS